VVPPVNRVLFYSAVHLALIMFVNIFLETKTAVKPRNPTRKISVARRSQMDRVHYRRIIIT